MAANWQTMDNAPKDRVINVYCPGVCPPTSGVLQGVWNTRLSIWELNPYGTVQPVALYPNRWCDIEGPPAGIT